MATKTKIDVPAVSALADIERERLNAIEEALQAEATGEPLSEDAELLIQVAGWDRKRLASERARAARIVKYREEAGTGEEREQARQAVDRITRESAVRRSELQVEIDRLSAELRGLDGAERDAVRRVGTMESAVDRLRDDAPEHIRRRVAFLRNEARERFVRTIASYESDIRQHDHLSSLHEDDLVRALKQHPETRHRCLTETLHGFGNGSKWSEKAINRDGLRDYLHSLGADRKRDELPELRRQLDEALAEADELLNHYVRD